MARHPPAAAAFLLLLLAALAPAAPPPPRGEKPFPEPVGSVTLDGEKTVYLVDGKVTIPRGARVTILKDVYVRAKGAGAVIEVEGSLDCRGALDREIVFEEVTVVPAASFQGLRLACCTFRGGGLATAEGAPAAGDLEARLCRFLGGTTVDLAFTAGSIRLLAGSHGGTTRLAGVDREGKENGVAATVQEFDSDGMRAENLADLTVRNCCLGKSSPVFRDNRALLLEGCRVEASEISLLQSKPGRFARTRLVKCDLCSDRIVLRAPKDPRAADTVLLDRCWFEGETKPEAVAERIVDGADEEDNNVRARVTRPMERPLGLAGTVDR